MPKRTREVVIDTLERNGKVIAYLVRYTTRKPRQRHLAAQFDVSYGLESVRAWIREQPHLIELKPEF